MKTLIIPIFALVAIVVSSCSTASSSVKPSDPAIIGRWTLVKITYGFSQVSTTPDKAGYSETLEFNTNGTFRRVVTDQKGQQEQTGNFYTGSNPTKTADPQAVFYSDDNTVQPYSYRDGHLLLYQRGPQQATIADGSTYEYAKQ